MCAVNYRPNVKLSNLYELDNAEVLEFFQPMLTYFVVVSLQVLRQEHIRGLIKGNSSAKTELIRLHTEVWMFLSSITLK